MISSNITLTILWLAILYIAITTIIFIYRYHKEKNENTQQNIYQQWVLGVVIVICVLIPVAAFFPNMYNIKINETSYIGWDLNNKDGTINFVDEDGTHEFKMIETQNVDGKIVYKTTGISAEYYPTGKCHIRGF